MFFSVHIVLKVYFSFKFWWTKITSLCRYNSQINKEIRRYQRRRQRWHYGVSSDVRCSDWLISTPVWDQSYAVSVFRLSERLIQKVKCPTVHRRSWALVRWSFINMCANKNLLSLIESYSHCMRLYGCICLSCQSGNYKWYCFADLSRLLNDAACSIRYLSA